MKTVRFSEIVKRCGAPEPHLLLLAPARDKALQAAIKAQRVMTVSQPTKGAATDFGAIGFEAGRARQYLVFPKSLRTFAGRRVVGIKYGMLSSKEIPKSQRADPPQPPKKPARKTAPTEPSPKPAAARIPPRRAPAPASKVVEFRAPQEEEDDDEFRKEIKRLARQAIRALEDGKQVATFHLLKRIAAL